MDTNTNINAVQQKNRHPTATFNKKAPSCPPNPIPVSVSVSDQAHDLSTWLRTHFERREIYHELGNNGLVCVNPGRLRPAGGVRVGHGGRGGGRDRDGDGGRGGGGVRKEEGGGDGDGGRDGDGEEEGDAGSTGDVVKGRERAVNGAGDKGVSRKSLDLIKRFLEKFLDLDQHPPDEAAGDPNAHVSNPNLLSQVQTPGQVPTSNPTSTSANKANKANKNKIVYTIIATGISGSGKTTILQQVLQVILLRGQTSTSATTTNSMGASGEGDPQKQTATAKYLEEAKNVMDVPDAGNDVPNTVAKNVLDVLERDLKIVEAMGNAVTQNNADSSRCGKLIKIEGIETANPRFTVQCLILEGSRLRYLCPDPYTNDKAGHNPERSFHIFYYLLAHGHPALEIKSIQDTFEGKFDRASAAEGWNTVNTAMLERKSASVVAQTWDVLAAIILLLCSRRADDTCGYIGKAKELLGIPMTMELVVSRTSPADVKARLLQISVNIYRRLFSFWTKPANEKKGSQEAGGIVINLLDICGTENLGVNRLAQLIINQWNDKIQQEYENIALDGLDNKPGRYQVRIPADDFDQMMDLLREDVSETHWTDWLRSRYQSIGPTKPRSKPDAKDTGESRLCITRTKGLTMTVNHLSGASVSYNHGDIPVENRDAKIPEIIQACSRVGELLLYNNNAPESKVTSTVVYRANRDWDAIKDALVKAKVLFIKCIKASATLEPWDFDANDFVAHQIDSLAIGRTRDFIKSLGMEHSDSTTNFICKYMIATKRVVSAAPSRVARHSQIEKFLNEIGSGWAEELVRQGDYVHWSTKLHAHLRELVAKYFAAVRDQENAFKNPAKPVEIAVNEPEQGNQPPASATLSSAWREAKDWYAACTQFDDSEWISQFEKHMEAFVDVFTRGTDAYEVLEADEALVIIIEDTIDRIINENGDGTRLNVFSAVVCAFFRRLGNGGGNISRKIASRTATFLGLVLLARYNELDTSPQMQAAVGRFVGELFGLQDW